MRASAFSPGGASFPLNPPACVFAPGGEFAMRASAFSPGGAKPRHRSWGCERSTRLSFTGRVVFNMSRLWKPMACTADHGPADHGPADKHDHVAQRIDPVAPRPCVLGRCSCASERRRLRSEVVEPGLRPPIRRLPSRGTARGSGSPELVAVALTVSTRRAPAERPPRSAHGLGHRRWPTAEG